MRRNYRRQPLRTQLRRIDSNDRFFHASQLADVRAVECRFNKFATDKAGTN